jgi:hypothetical protein
MIGFGSILTALRYGVELLVVGRDLVQAARGSKEPDETPEPDHERQRAGSMAAREESKHAGPKR